MINFDVVFLDNTCPQPYDTRTMQYSAMGGTEAATVLVAEALALCGLKVAVLQHNLHQEQIGSRAFYLPMSRMNDILTKNAIALRGVKGLEKLDNRVNKIAWLHDLPSSRDTEYRQYAVDNNVKLVCVSSWHKTDLQRLLCDPNQLRNPAVTYIYNPIPDGICVPKSEHLSYNPQKLVWISSPHKGFDRALFLFERLKEVVGDPKLELHVYNPGYIPGTEKPQAGVVYHGATPRDQMWEQISTALCVFYPTQWKETFGMMAAEANAIHLPVATYSLAGLTESVSDLGGQKSPPNDEKCLLDTVASWYDGKRPNVYANNKFKLSEVIPRWIRILKL